VLPETAPLLSVIVRVALRVLMPEGVKVTVIVQLAPAATDEPQLLVWLNSLALAPPMLMPVTDKAADPMLVRVTVCAVLLVPTIWLGKAGRIVVDRLATGSAPVPVSVIVSVLVALPDSPLF
jgi:hypothetical protein